MVELLGAAAVGLAASGAVFVAVLLLRRLHLARAERVRLDAEARVRPVALALVHGEPVELRPVGDRDAQALAALVARLARSLSGEPRRHVAAFFEASGAIAREREALRRRAAWRRATAAYALGDMASAEAVPALLEALDDREREVRAAAARSLGRLGAVHAVEPLVFALVEGRVPRAVAGQALLAVGPAALTALRPLVQHVEGEVRASAIELVGLLGDASDEPLLVERLRDTSAEVRAKACRALGRLAAEEAAPKLERALEDRIPFVRVNAAGALAALGDRAVVPALLAQARDDPFFEAARAAAHAAARLDPAAVRAASRQPGAPALLHEAADVLEIGR